MSANSSAPAERRFTLTELKRCDGSDPALPVLIAHAGRVYDVSRSYPWARGCHWGDLRAGQDLTGRMDPRIHGAGDARARALRRSGRGRSRACRRRLAHLGERRRKRGGGAIDDDGIVETGFDTPLVDLSFFARREFVMGVALGSLSMFSFMSVLLYFNLYAQSRGGLGLTALEAGASLLPLSAALLALALSASALATRVGLRKAMTGGMALIAIGSAIIGVAISGAGMAFLAIGFLAMGAGLAVPYASAPRLALSALSSEQTGQGSGIVNACTFLGGSCGVAGGAIAFTLRGFVAVLTMIGLAGIIGAALSCRIPKTE